MNLGISNKSAISFLPQFILISLMLHKGKTQTVIQGDWTTSLPENLLTENNHTWELINCTYDSDNDPSPRSKLVTDDYRIGKERRSNWSSTSDPKSEADQNKKEKLAEYTYKRPTLIEALTKGYKHPLRIFWALFSQLSTMSDSPDEDQQSKKRNCSPSGTIYDSHVTLCPYCPVRTKLPDGYIPPYIDEVICERTNVACFRKQGKCFQRYMKITALRKIQGSHCLLADQNGHQFWTENWEIYDQKVRVSCECLLNKHSKFLKYALSFK